MNVEILQAITIPELVVTENFMSFCHSKTSLKVSDDTEEDHQYPYRMYNKSYEQKITK